MELAKAVEQEIILRDHGKTGKLGNLRYIQLLCLAHKMHITLKG